MNEILLALMVSLIVSGAAQAGHHEEENNVSAMGVKIFDDGRSVPLVAGAQANVVLWQDYIQAHNDRDFDKIAAMNAENFEGIVPTGERIIGSEAQAEFLKAWIAESNPVWKVMYVVANDGENTEGKMEEWLSTGQMISSTDADGNQTAEYHSISVKLEGGKIRQVYVAAMQMPSEQTISIKQGLKLGGVNTAARIMNLVKIDEMDSVLGDLTSLDRKLAQRVIDAMIRFEELAEADSRSLQTLVRNV